MSQSGKQKGRRWVAIITGAISVLIGVLYLLLIALLDSRGPMLPPPPEAMGLAVNAAGALEATGVPAPAGVAPPG